jgi:hypothetical protein
MGLTISQSQILSVVTIVGVWANYLLPVFLIGYTVWWAYTMRKGSRIHRSTLALHIVVYGLAAFYVYFVSFNEFYAYGDRLEILGALWMVGSLAITYVAVRMGMWYGGRTLKVIQTESGHWHLRGPIEIVLFWAGLFTTRYVLEDTLLQGYSVLFPVYSLPAGISVPVFSAVVIIIASLYLVSFGFLCGVSIAEWNLHAQTLRANVSAGSPPGPVPGPSFAGPEPATQVGSPSPSAPEPGGRP